MHAPSESGFADAARRLAEHRRIWDEKRVLRDLYSEWYAALMAHLVPGPTVELGSGPGSLRQHCPGAIATDIVHCPWLDAVADAACLPFRTASLANLVLFDVLHHLEAPAAFFAEAGRTVRPGGRVILMEPYASPISRMVFALFHPEPVDLSIDPLALAARGGERRDPFEANQGFATRLFWRDLAGTMRRLPRFRLIVRSRDALLRYPLSGGFGRPAFLPEAAFGPLARLEQWLAPLAPFLAFRTVIVLERAG